ncbi:hypothetical protein OII_03651 [Enterococcus faecium EnGen0029]|nr:hypothetical protein OII_03651 [Enterococcus faecium EnGen0029]
MPFYFSNLILQFAILEKILLDTTAVLIVKTKTVRYNACKVDF